MSKFIQTIPTGSTRAYGQAEGSIIAILSCTRDLEMSDFDDAYLQGYGIGLAQIPDSSAPTIGAVLATALANGTGNAPFADNASLIAGMLHPPGERFKRVGSAWVDESGGSAGVVDSLTITTAGTGYTVDTSASVYLQTRTDATLANLSAITPFGLTVDVTSVGSNGEITGVAINTPGWRFKEGDTLSIKGGDGNAIITVGSITYPTIATFSTGRPTAAPNTLNASYIQSVFAAITGSILELYQPTTGIVVAYDATLANPGFVSADDIFNGSDFTLEVRAAGGGPALAVITVPLTDTNQTVNFVSRF